MYFSDYFEKYLLNDLSIQKKIKQLKERDLIYNNIINNYEYIEWLVNYLNNKENDDNINHLKYFYCAIKQFLENNYYYEFYNYNNFVLKYKNYLIGFKYNNDLFIDFIDKSDVFIDFENIVNKKESINKQKYLEYFDVLSEMKKILPKKLLKEKLEQWD